MQQMCSGTSSQEQGVMCRSVAMPMSHIMKIWGRAVEARLRRRVMVSEEQCSADAMFAFRVLMEKVR